MTCLKYNQLTDFEQSLFLAKVIHCVSNSDELFTIGEDVIRLGILKGVFNNVKFGNQEIGESIINENERQ